MSKDKRRITIYDIAAAAGISAPTVSLVLSGRWKKNRVSAKTAERVLSKARELGYSPNLGARGLRLQRSGLCGMIVPHYRNRFFAGLAEAFEHHAREAGLCPVVVSTHRDSETERLTVEKLVAHQVEFLFVAGVRDPLEINRICAGADIRSINIDLPGEEAPSAISDNRAAAQEMAELMLGRFAGGREIDFMFIGGDALDNATMERIEGVRAAFAARGLPLPDSAIDPCGYTPSHIAEVVRALDAARRGRMPNAILANGVTALEGMLMASSGPRADMFDGCVIGCYDWDPFAASLPLDITFVRQDVEGLIAAGFSLLESFRKGESPTVRIPAQLRASRMAPQKK